MSVQLFLIILFFLTVVIHLLYLFLFILPLNVNLSMSKRHSDNKEGKSEPVSIIIAVHNEEDNIDRLIHALRKQDYPSYEIHIIDDYSTDKTRESVKKYESTIHNLHYHENKLAQGKKNALRHGIEAVDCELLLFTDADCVPRSKKWISSMVNALGEKEICLAYGKYQKKAGFFNDFIQFETGMIASQYMAFAVRQIPYMGVGRNLMYRKSLFMKSDKYNSHEDLRSGDDDLFIAQYATADNTTINLQRESFTISQPEESLRNLFFQKRRHLSTSTEYPLGIKARLGMISLSNMYFYILALILFVCYPQISFYVLGTVIVKWGIDMLFYFRIFRRFGIYDIFYLFPFLDIAMCIYYFILAPFIYFKKTDTW